MSSNETTYVNGSRKAIIRKTTDSVYSFETVMSDATRPNIGTPTAIYYRHEQALDCAQKWVNRVGC